MFLKKRCGKSSKRALALAVTLGVMICGGSVWAADVKAGDVAEYSLDEYSITATRTKMDVKDVPQATSVVTAEDIKRLGAHTVREALLLTSNLDLQEAGMVGNQVQVRGNDSRHTLVLVNGKRMAAENTSSSMNAYELTRINIEDVERIEVVKGNGSALYGSDAIGGVINIITKKVTASQMSVNTYTGDKSQGITYSYSSGKENNVGVRISAGIEKTRENTTSYYSNQYGGTSSSTNMYGIRRFINTTVEYDIDAKHGLELDAAFMREQKSALSITPTTEGFNKYDNNRTDLSLNYYGSDSNHDYNIRVYHNTLKKFNPSYSNGKYSDFQSNNYYQTALEAKDSVKLGKSNVLTFGGEIRKETFGSTYLEDSGDNVTNKGYDGITKPFSEKSNKIMSGYIQDEIWAGKKLLILPAIRVDHHDSFGTHASPKLGSTYKFNDNSRIKVNWGKGYRAPSLYELYSQMTRPYMAPMFVVQVKGNENLEPETSTNFDISLEAEKGKASGKLTYFHNKVDNLIEQSKGSITMDPVIYKKYGKRLYKSSYENKDNATIKGAELELGYSFDKHWSVKTCYNYLDATDDNGRLSYRARQSGNVQLVYTDAKENPLNITLYNQYYVDYKCGTDENSYTYSTTNLIVDKVFSKNLRVYGGVTNIFDKTFDLSDDVTYAIDGRGWRLGAEWKF